MGNETFWISVTVCASLRQSTTFYSAKNRTRVIVCAKFRAKKWHEVKRSIVYTNASLFAQVWDKVQRFTLLKIEQASLLAQNFMPIVGERGQAHHCLYECVTVCAKFTPQKGGGGHLVKIAHTLLFVQKQLNNFKLAPNSKIPIKSTFFEIQKIHTKTFKQMSNK